MKTIKVILISCIGVILLAIVLIAMPASNALADATPANNPSLGSNVLGIGTEAWVDPGNITSAGSPYATITLYMDHQVDHTYSNYLGGTSYGFQVPSDATITGIEVKINRMANLKNPSVFDNQVSLVKGGTIVGENKAMTTTWPMVMTMVIYGGPNDLWGVTWTPEEVNAENFGAVLAVFRDNNGNKPRQAFVDTMQITVYYTSRASTSLNCEAGAGAAYGGGVTCVITVTSLIANHTPSGLVNWLTDGSGDFSPNPCTLTGANGIATCSTTYTPTQVGSGTHLISAAYEGDGFFAADTAEQSIKVVPRPIEVTADGKTKQYGDPDPLLTYLISSGSLVFGDTFSGALGRQPGENPGTYAIQLGTLALSSNYDLNFVSADLTITKRAITITADAKTKMVGQPDPVLTFQVTSGSLLVGDTFSGALTREAGETVGSYPILIGTVSLPSSYYELTYVGANLTIVKAKLYTPLLFKG